MRLLSRLGSWLRSERPSDAEQLSFSLSPHPATVPDVFAQRLVELVRKAHASDQALLTELDPTIQALALPLAEDGSTDALSDDIDNAIARLQSAGRMLSSLTWSALRDAHPGFSPTFRDWAGEHAELFDGGAGIVFFVDLDGIAQATANAIARYGFTTQYDEDAARLTATDGRFVAHVGLHALLAESLWTARGPLSTLERRARRLPTEFRGFDALRLGLKRRFVGRRFWVDEDELRVSDTTGEIGNIDYRAVAASIRNRGLSIDSWLARATLADIMGTDGDPHVQLRSSMYGRAFEHHMIHDGGDHTVLVARQEADGRCIPVTTSPDDPPGRYQHYVDEANRQVAYISFASSVFVIDDDERFVVGLVGDRIASVALNDRWVKGMLERLVPLTDIVSIRANTENTLLVYHPKVRASMLEAAERSLGWLSDDLYPEGSDALSYARQAHLENIEAAGDFTLTLVADYFALREASDHTDHTRPGGDLFLRAVAMQAIDQPEAARRYYEKAIRTDPSSSDYHLALGRLLMGQEQASEAAPFLKAAAKRSPKSPDIQNALGMVHALLGDHDAATKAFEQAIRLDPKEAAYLVNLGKTLTDAYRFDKARACLERALTMNPESAEGHATMAVLCLKAGDDDEAQRHARRAISEDPDNETVLKILKSVLESD